MAFKPGPTRIESETINFFAASGFYGEGGGVVSYASGMNPSGVSYDGIQNQAAYLANPSGAKPIGIMLQDVKATDVTKYELNPYRDEVSGRSKITIVQKGNLVTNFIGGTPVAGDNAYLGGTGTITPTSGTGAPRIGKFVTSKGPDGFAEVRVDL